MHHSEHRELARLIWSVSELLRDTFRRSLYPDVILPLTLLRRLDCALAPTRALVLEECAQTSDRESDLTQLTGYAFYNTSPYDLAGLLAEPGEIIPHFSRYLDGWSRNIRELLEVFDVADTIARLDDSDLLVPVLKRFAQIDLHPRVISNAAIGDLFQELLRISSIFASEHPGSHYTPRDIVRLMARLLLPQDDEQIGPMPCREIYDPCCGTGGLLIGCLEAILEQDPQSRVALYGQEINPQACAICRADLYLRGDGNDATRITLGSTLSCDTHAGKHFAYQLANPPYGASWERDRPAVLAEARRGSAGRFVAGVPRVSDSQMLFLEHLLAHMRPVEEGGGRIAFISDGSPLFTGKEASGESTIRRWLFERDLLEAVIALPEGLFYNAGIATYIWLISNNKEPRRRGLVQLVDARERWTSMRRPLGKKRREVTDQQIDQIVSLVRAFEQGPDVQIHPNSTFGYRAYTIEQPLRLTFQTTTDHLARVAALPAFQELGKDTRDGVLAMLSELAADPCKDRAAFTHLLLSAAAGRGIRLTQRLCAALLDSLAERDETAEICRDATGKPEPDPRLCDIERVMLQEDIQSFFEREVKPYVPDAWINTEVRDQVDGAIGRVGYAIHFNRLFYRYQPPRSLAEIEADIRQLAHETERLLRDILDR